MKRHHSHTLALSKPTALAAPPTRFARFMPWALGTPFANAVRQGIDAVDASWFTSVMGTGILAICLTIVPLPLPLPLGPSIGIALWSVATALFAALAILSLAAFARSPRSVAATFADPLKAQAWGAPPMACFTLAVGFLKIGSAILPGAACMAAAQVLWIAGVAGSLMCAFTVPYLMFTRHELTPQTTFGNWLLPVVPPIVASVPGALLIPTWPAALRGNLLALTYALLGTGLILAAINIVLFYSRLLYHKVPAGPLVPTMWLVVGPLGQSIAGALALGTASATVWPQFGGGLLLAALGYSVLTWGFAMYWLGMAIVVTLRAACTHLPFTLGWWAFTFPVGVLTAGTVGLYGQTHAGIFALTSAGLLALLSGMWLLVATRTLRAAFRLASPHRA